LCSSGINQFLALLEFFSSRVLPFVLWVSFAGKSQCLFLSRVCYIKAPLFLSIFFNFFSICPMPTDLIS
ncbi:hypothetical protein GIB67_019753, partial [Kingdonia uniflora]